MDDEMFFRDFQSFIALQLKSSFDVSIRTANDNIFLSFHDQYDFVTAVLAATGSNIRTIVIGAFGERVSGNRNIESCCLKLELASGCLDIRLLYFMYEVLKLRLRDNKISNKIFDIEMSGLQKYEHWLDQSP